MVLNSVNAGTGDGVAARFSIGRLSNRFGPLAALSIIGAALILYWPSIAWMAGEWSSGNALFSQGYLIAAISAYLIVRSAIRIEDQDVSHSWLGLVCLLFLSAAWLLGFAGSIAVVFTTALPFLTLAAVWAALGFKAAKRVMVGVLFLCFALPIWQYIQPPFRDFAIVLIDLTVSSLGIPVFVEGNLVHLPAGSFRIINGCSGVNFIVVGLALSTLYGHLYFRSWKPRIYLATTAVGLALFANWVRVVSLALIGNATAMQSELVYDHSNYGWLLFAVTLVPLFAVARKLERTQEYVTIREEIVSGSASLRWQSKSLAIIGITLLMAVSPVWAVLAMGKQDAEAKVLIALPAGQGRWNGPGDSNQSWRPKFVGASGEAQGVYRAENSDVWLYQNVYLTQDQGRELVFIHNDVAGNLRSGSSRSISVSLPDGSAFDVNSRNASRGSQSWLIWYWYIVGERRVAREVTVKAIQAVSTLRGKSEAGIVAIAATCADTCDGVDQVLREFVMSGTPLMPIAYEQEDYGR